MPGYIFYTIAIAFTSGILSRSFFVVGEAEVLFLMVLAFVFGVVWRRASVADATDARRPRLYLLSSLALLFFALGIFRLDVVDRIPAPLAARVGSEVQLEGVVARQPDERARTVHLYIALSNYDETLLVIADRFEAFAYGDRVVVSGELILPESFETDLGRTFDYPGYLKARGVHHMIIYGDIEQRSSGEGNPFIAFLLNAKVRFMHSLERIVPEPYAGLGEGLLLGEKRALGEELEETFRRAGIIHIVVLSGYNVMIVAEAIMRLLAYAFGLRTRVVIGIVAIASFALMVGLSATVVCASVMAALVLFARALGRTYVIMRALTIAGILMLVINPYLLAFDPGFQLSFIATLALLFVAPLIEQKLQLVPTTFQIREFVTATVATQILVLPLLLYAMGELSIVSVVVNVLVLPLVPLAMLLTFLTGIVTFVSSGVGMLVGFGAYMVLKYIILVAQFFTKSSLAAVAVPAFPFWIAILAYAAMTLALWYLWSRKGESFQEEGEVREADDKFDDWEIEEEKPPEMRSISGGSSI